MRWLCPRYASPDGVVDHDIGTIPGLVGGHDSRVEILKHLTVSHAHQGHRLGKLGGNPAFILFIYERKYPALETLNRTGFPGGSKP